MQPLAKHAEVPLEATWNLDDLFSDEAAWESEVLAVDLLYCDIKAPLDPEFNPQVPYEEGCRLILDALEVVGADYRDFAGRAMVQRWVDRADNIGKSSGAFCASPYGVHPYILITWSSTPGAPRRRFQAEAAVGVVAAEARQLLQRPRPRRRASGLPSPVLKLAWHLMHTYILELDIIGRTPGSALGRAAVYSACVWRSLTLGAVDGAEAAPVVAAATAGLVVGRRLVVMAGGAPGVGPGLSRSAYCPPNRGAPHPAGRGARIAADPDRSRGRPRL
jgi:hypothetical protein